MKMVVIVTVFYIFISNSAIAAADEISGVYLNKSSTIDLLKLDDSRVKFYFFTRDKSKYSYCELGGYGNVENDTIVSTIPNPIPFSPDCEISIKLTGKTASITVSEFCQTIAMCAAGSFIDPRIKSGQYTKMKSKTVLQPDANTIDEEDRPPVNIFFGARR